MEKKNIFHFKAPDTLLKWWDRHQTDDSLFLCDYELLGHKKTGLDVIEALNVGKIAVLVTSHFEEKQIRKACKFLNVKLLPKNLAGFVPIRIKEINHQHINDHLIGDLSDADCAQRIITPKYNVIVIDDNEDICIAWRTVKTYVGANKVKTFLSVEACKAENLDFKEYDIAFVDKNIHHSAWRIDQTIAYLKTNGVKKVFIASGEMLADLEQDPLCDGANGIISGKIPNNLQEFFCVSGVKYN